MSYLTTKKELAKIAIAKNLIKEYQDSDSERTVYLDDGTEFQIYLKNPYQSHLGIKIYVNNQSIGNMLVLKPGESIWLERFMDTDKKFLFSTYKVDDTAEVRYAISNNGKVKVEFYHECETKSSYIYPNYNYPNITWTNDGGWTSVSIDNNLTKINDSYTTNCYCNTITSDCKLSASSLRDVIDMTDNVSNIIETGRVEKGSKSHQEFEYCNFDFDYTPFKTEIIVIHPSSRKRVMVEDTRRRYCVQCGKRVHPKDKYCSNCGAKLY